MSEAPPKKATRFYVASVNVPGTAKRIYWVEDQWEQRYRHIPWFKPTYQKWRAAKVCDQLNSNHTKQMSREPPLPA